MHVSEVSAATGYFEDVTALEDGTVGLTHNHVTTEAAVVGKTIYGTVTSVYGCSADYH